MEKSVPSGARLLQRMNLVMPTVNVFLSQLTTTESRSGNTGSLITAVPPLNASEYPLCAPKGCVTSKRYSCPFTRLGILVNVEILLVKPTGQLLLFVPSRLSPVFPGFDERLPVTISVGSMNMVEGRTPVISNRIQS